MNAIVHVVRFWPSLERFTSLLLSHMSWGLNSSCQVYQQVLLHTEPYNQPRTQNLLFTFMFLVPRNKIEWANGFILSLIPWNGNKISIFTNTKAEYQYWGYSSMMQHLLNISNAWFDPKYHKDKTKWNDWVSEGGKH